MYIVNQTHDKPTKSRHKKLLADPDVKRWYQNIARGSTMTADVRLRRLGVYCERTRTTPKELAQMGIDSVKNVEDALLDYVSFLERSQYAPSYIEDILKALRSWLSFNYVRLMRKIKIKNADIPVTLENEEIPTKSKLREVLDSASARQRVAVSLVAFAGLRPQVLGKYDSSDGLKLSDIKDLEVKPDGTDITFTNTPARVMVRANLSKTGNQYFTYLPEAGCRFLQGYVRERIANGEKIDSDSPVVTVLKGYRIDRKKRSTHDQQQQRKTFFLATNTISNNIRAAFGIIIKERPYILRAYFDTQLLLAESKGKITHAYRQFFMGHKGDIEAKYTTNKHRLPEHLVTDMKEAYERSQGFLTPFESSSETTDERSKKELFLEMWKEQAKLYGIDPMKMKIEKQRVGELENDNAVPMESSADIEIDAIKTAIQGTISKSNDNSNYNGDKPIKKYESMMASGEGELLSCVEDGWSIVKELSNGKVILRRDRITAPSQSD